MAKETIRDFYGKILGTVETFSNGDKELRDFYGKILGRYQKSDNTTRNFFGQTVANGDALMMLLK